MTRSLKASWRLFDPFGAPAGGGRFDLPVSSALFTEVRLDRLRQTHGLADSGPLAKASGRFDSVCYRLKSITPWGKLLWLWAEGNSHGADAAPSRPCGCPLERL